MKLYSFPAYNGESILIEISILIFALFRTIYYKLNGTQSKD